MKNKKTNTNDYEVPFEGVNIDWLKWYFVIIFLIISMFSRIPTSVNKSLDKVFEKHPNYYKVSGEKYNISSYNYIVIKGDYCYVEKVYKRFFTYRIKTIDSLKTCEGNIYRLY